MAQDSQFPPVCDYEGSDYQASFWEQGGRAYEDQVEAVALRRLLPPAGELLLEIGAGAGRNTHRYAGYRRVVLLDYSRSQLELARERLGLHPRYVFVAANAYRMPFVDSLFDGATMIRTLHHMADAPRSLREVRRILSRKAVFILEYANKLNLKAIARYFLRRQDWSPFDPAPLEFAELNFDFHPASIRRWLHESGFVVERQLSVSHFRLQFLKRLLPVRLLVSLDAAAQLTGDWWQLTPSVFVRSRAAGGQREESLPLEAIAAAGQDDLPLTIFRCPACDHSPLHPVSAGLVCPACQRGWGLQNGIYDFREPGESFSWSASFSNTQK